ncbi:MAG: trehalose-phosphatase, partial [Longimicrobiales bacterium]|nr:trehalose-phosphatase [Longimicrobiales bacterium]
MNVPDHWARLARHSPVALLLDFDGTLVPLAARPELARPDPALVELLDSLAASPGLIVAVVSGRGRADLERRFEASNALWLAAEHGALLRGDGVWRSLLPGEGSEMDDLHATLEGLARREAGAMVERKSWSVAFHFRGVARRAVPALMIEVEAASRTWMRMRPGYDIVPGAQSLEVRSTNARKSVAVPWVREKGGLDTRIVAFGDDITDEDMFSVLGAGDDGVLVASGRVRATTARWLVDSPADVLGFLGWLQAARAGGTLPETPVLPRPIPAWVRPPRPGSGCGLLAVSNRLPELRDPVSPDAERTRPVGGLVAALQPVLTGRGGLWLGWSGRTVPGDAFGPVRIDTEAVPALAWLDLPATAHERYYNGFCNRSLWPLFHTLPGRVRFDDADWDAYVAVNDRLAEAAVELIPSDGAVWAHDFHLLLLAAGLRNRGHRGPLGLFLHVPFPGLDMFRIIPWADRLLDGMLAFDLVGLQTENDVRNFLQVVGALSPATVADDVVEHRGRRIRVRAFPIGIVPESFEPAAEAEEGEETTGLLQSVAGTRLVLGVDRLDYTKGIPERLEAFARLLIRFPEWRGKASLVQISVPSRADVLEYQEQRRRIEAAVGRINGEFGEAHWTPVRYLYRSYRRDQLSRFYRAADVCLVTPLRDGMNLVAKEFVASREDE